MKPNRPNAKTRSRTSTKNSGGLAAVVASLATTKGKMLAFALVFGVLGVAYLAFSSAATPPKYFDPGGNLTRQSAAVFLYRAHYSAPATATASPESSQMSATKCGSGKPGPYADVSATSEFCKEIEWAGSKGIMTPDTKNNINPTAEVTRQSMAAFMYRAANSPAFTPPAKAEFKDVPTNHTFYKEISWMKANNITTGYSDGTFKPTAVLDRQAAAAFLYRKAGSPAIDTAQVFQDVLATHPFYQAIQWIGKENISQGYEATCLKAGTTQTYGCTKTEAAKQKSYLTDKVADCLKAGTSETYKCTMAEQQQQNAFLYDKSSDCLVAGGSGATYKCTPAEKFQQNAYLFDKTADCVDAGGGTKKCTPAERAQQDAFLRAAQAQADADAAVARAAWAAAHPPHSNNGSTSSDPCEGRAYSDCMHDAWCSRDPGAVGCTPRVSISSCITGKEYYSSSDNSCHPYTTTQGRGKCTVFNKKSNTVKQVIPGSISRQECNAITNDDLYTSYVYETN